MKDMSGDSPAWTAQEDLNLLNAIEVYSFGNWEDIAKSIPRRSAIEARQEYVNKFLEGSIGRATWSEVSHRKPILHNLVDGESDVLANDSVSTLSAVDIQPEEARQLFYYPLRDDFEIEYDNGAESLVSSLSFNEEEDELEIALKLTQVDMYTERVRERKRRHRIVKDHQLIANFLRHHEKAKKKVSKDEIMRRKFVRFSQFYTGEEYEQVLDTLMAKHKLSRRLAELLRYRHFGLTSFDSLPEFEKQSIMRKNVCKERLPFDEERRKRSYKKKLSFSGGKLLLGSAIF